MAVEKGLGVQADCACWHMLTLLELFIFAQLHGESQWPFAHLIVEIGGHLRMVIRLVDARLAVLVEALYCSVQLSVTGKKEKQF